MQWCYIFACAFITNKTCADMLSSDFSWPCTCHKTSLLSLRFPSGLCLIWTNGKILNVGYVFALCCICWRQVFLSHAVHAELRCRESWFEIHAWQIQSCISRLGSLGLKWVISIEMCWKCRKCDRLWLWRRAHLTQLTLRTHILLHGTFNDL